MAGAVILGDAVEAGQRLLTIEGMKMETVLYAEGDPGTVTEITAAAGVGRRLGDDDQVGRHLPLAPSSA